MLDSALPCWRVRKQAGRAPLKINELRTDPISFATFPKLDVAGSSPGARFSNSPRAGRAIHLPGPFLCAEHGHWPEGASPLGS